MVLTGLAIRANDAGGRLAPEFSEKTVPCPAFPTHTPQRVRGRSGYG